MQLSASQPRRSPANVKSDLGAYVFQLQSVVNPTISCRQQLELSCRLLAMRKMDQHDILDFPAIFTYA